MNDWLDLQQQQQQKLNPQKVVKKIKVTAAAESVELINLFWQSNQSVCLPSLDKRPDPLGPL